MRCETLTAETINTTVFLLICVTMQTGRYVLIFQRTCHLSYWGRRCHPIAKKLLMKMMMVCLN